MHSSVPSSFFCSYWALILFFLFSSHIRFRSMMLICVLLDGFFLVTRLGLKVHSASSFCRFSSSYYRFRSSSILFHSPVQLSRPSSFRCWMSALEMGLIWGVKLQFCSSSIFPDTFTAESSSFTVRYFDLAIFFDLLFSFGANVHCFSSSGTAVLCLQVSVSFHSKKPRPLFFCSAFTLDRTLTEGANVHSLS